MWLEFEQILVLLRDHIRMHGQ